MKRRTKFTIVAIIAIVAMGVAETWLVTQGQTYPDVFIVGWYAAWTVELALLFGLKVKNKDEI